MMPSSYQQLFNIKAEYTKMRKASPGLFLLLKQKIERFHQVNALRITLMENEIRRLQDKYILADSAGNLLFDKDQAGKVIWKWSAPDSEKNFDREMNFFMNKNIELHI